MKERDLINAEDNIDEHVYDDVRDEMRALVTAVSDVIKEHPIFQEKNFGLFYQHGRLGYMDLDMFADRAAELLKAEEEKKLDKEK